MSMNTRKMNHSICKEKGLTGIFYMLRYMYVKVSYPFSFKTVASFFIKRREKKGGSV